jgi:hypothetical protein
LLEVVDSSVSSTLYCFFNGTAFPFAGSTLLPPTRAYLQHRHDLFDRED